jgi:hypothetical protein
LAIVTKIVDFSDGIQAQAYTMFASEKVSERNENCRFQPAYVRKAIAEKSCQLMRLGGHKSISPSRAWKCGRSVRLVQSPDPGLGTATASLLITVSING